MILKGSQRAGAKQLAAHLLKAENEHVEIYELRGFVSDDLKEALHEAYAVSRGTRCKQFLFSLSLNPPEYARVSDRDFKAAIREIEQKLGLEDQPRAIVFHEKEGRRHAHCVWSRIDSETMTAINLPYYKLKLRDISRELYIKHGWKMPLGLVDSQARDPATFTRAEWQQAMRAGQDPKALKAMFQECWAISDSRKAFTKALQERGYYLSQGDRRGFVAVDFRGEVYAISKWTGQRTKEVKARLGDPQSLPSLAETKALIAARMTNVLQRFVQESETGFQKQEAVLSFRKADLARRHQHERERLRTFQEARWTAETNRRAARLSRGLQGLWDRLTGKYRRMRQENERQAYDAFRRDQRQKETLIYRQLDERRTLQADTAQVRQTHAQDMAQLHRDVAHYMRMNAERPPRVQEAFRKATQEQPQAQTENRGRSRRRRRTRSPED